MTERYPLAMSHPAYSPGVAGSQGTIDPETAQIVGARHGSPCRFPPVAAATRDEEDQYRAKGYLPNGEAPAAVVGYAEYPKMLAHPDHVDAVPERILPQRDPDTGSIITTVVPGKPEKYPAITVNSREEETAANLKGYQMPSLPDPQAVQRSRSVPYDPKANPAGYPRWENGALVSDPNLNTSGRIEYPKWVGDVLVNNAEEEAALNHGDGSFSNQRIEALISERRAASEQDDDATVARIEKLLSDNGIEIKDRPHGTVWKRVEVVAAITLAPAKPEPAAAAEDTADERAALFAEAERRGIEVNRHWKTPKLREFLAEKAA